MSSWALQLRCGARRLARRLRLSSGQGSLRKPRRNDRGPSCGGGNSSFQPRSELIYSAPSRGHPLLPTDRESGPDRLTTCLRGVGPTHLSSRLVQRNEEVETKPESRSDVGLRASMPIWVHASASSPRRGLRYLAASRRTAQRITQLPTATSLMRKVSSKECLSK
jgi:hypothetical protein